MRDVAYSLKKMFKNQVKKSHFRYKNETASEARDELGRPVCSVFRRGRLSLSYSDPNRSLVRSALRHDGWFYFLCAADESTFCQGIQCSLLPRYPMSYQASSVLSAVRRILRLSKWECPFQLGRMNRFFILLMFAIVVCPNLDAREAKEYDKDVNYDEERIPDYDLPPLLVSSMGKPITTPEEWFSIRRPEILSLFANVVYGRVPEPAYPVNVRFEVVETDPQFMGGKATRKDVKIHLENENGRMAMHFLVFSPNKATKPAPAFFKHSFNNTQSDDFDASATRPGFLKNGWPLGEMFDRGYGFCAVYQQDLVKHNEVEFLNSIHKLFYPKGQSFPKAHEWGVLSVCAWGASRGMDYLETDPDIDHTRIAIMGHSKMGKATLWTAAQDERFALAISAQSGCAGAALWRRKSGETLKKMVTRFPYWLCRNAWKFVEQEDDMPVDQHMLLACIAPRPVYVHSATGDTWADARGEYLSAYHASEVYRLLGKKGLESSETPDLRQPIQDSEVGYHIREGGHSIEMYDWVQFMNFADHHFKP